MLSHTTVTYNYVRTRTHLCTPSEHNSILITKVSPASITSILLWHSHTLSLTLFLFPDKLRWLTLFLMLLSSTLTALTQHIPEFIHRLILTFILAQIPHQWPDYSLLLLTTSILVLLSQKVEQWPQLRNIWCPLTRTFSELLLWIFYFIFWTYIFRKRSQTIVTNCMIRMKPILCYTGTIHTWWGG